MNNATLVAPQDGEKKRRRTETQNKIITEAWALINQSDNDDFFTVRKLAERVGVTAGRILQYYKTIDAMLLDVFVVYYKPIFAELESKVNADPASATWRGRIRVATQYWANSYYQHRVITRRAMAFSWRFDPKVREQFKEFNDLLFDALNRCFDDPNRPLPRELLKTATRAWYRIMLQGIRLGFQNEESAEACVANMWPMIDVLIDGVEVRRAQAAA
jgi:AcrR family transcriptional regulator